MELTRIIVQIIRIKISRQSCLRLVYHTKYLQSIPLTLLRTQFQMGSPHAQIGLGLYPSYPALPENVRFATAADINALVPISSLSISGTKLVKYVSAKQLNDSLIAKIKFTHYTEMVKHNLSDPKRVVVVYESTQSPLLGFASASTGFRKFVVGLAVLQFPEGSTRVGQFCVNNLRPERGIFQGFEMQRLQIVHEVSKLGCKTYAIWPVSGYIYAMGAH